MQQEQDELFASVDALLAQVAAQDGLPEPEERRRLRRAAGLSQEQIARALEVRREAVSAWEAGRSEPRPPTRAAYIRLLDGLAARHPATQDSAPRAESGAAPAPPAGRALPVPPEVGDRRATRRIAA